MKRNKKRVLLLLFDLFMIYLSFKLTAIFIPSGANFIVSNQYFLVASVMIAYVCIASYFNVYSLIQSFTNFHNLFIIPLSLLCTYVIVILLNYPYWATLGIEKILLSLMLSILFIVLGRVIWWESNNFPVDSVSKHKNKTKRTLIIGASKETVTYLDSGIRERLAINPVAILDEDKTRVGDSLQNIPIIGDIHQIEDAIVNHEIQQVVITSPSLNTEDYEQIMLQCQKVGVAVMLVPKCDGEFSENIKARDIDVTDLLDREEVTLNQALLKKNIFGKTILVTGAGGSIGSEICRQVSRFKPARLILLGHGENSIFWINRELSTKYGKELEIIPLIADIQDRERIFQIMRDYRPHRVYHAAAHKHVPLMELNPFEAVKNNIFGTKNVAEAAKSANVEKFVMISTDKAVNPPNIMGATKRVAEMIVTSLNEEGKTQFSAVRFGNVLGSQGSIVPIFEKQIEQGGPITITDFRMTRYFMTISEAAGLVVQAGELMNGGEVFVLDMGKPIKVLDLAKKMILLSGHTEQDIQIIETGIRPGEKLYEELLTSEERLKEQVHEKIFVGKVSTLSQEEVFSFIQPLLSMKVDVLRHSLLNFAQQ